MVWIQENDGYMLVILKGNVVGKKFCDGMGSRE
jgi:hypothetical protein